MSTDEEKYNEQMLKQYGREKSGQTNEAFVYKTLEVPPPIQFKAPSPQQHSFAEIMEFAKTVSESKVLGLVTPAQVAVIMLLAQAEGVHPIHAIRDYHIIQNRPALKSTTLLRRFQKAGGTVQWIERTDIKVEGKFTHPSTEEPSTVIWTIEDAKRAALTTKEVWVKYPRHMLTARVIAEGVQLVYPEALGGLVTVEEAQDMPLQTDFIDGTVIESAELRATLLEEQKKKDDFKKLDSEFHALASTLYAKVYNGHMARDIGLSEFEKLAAGYLAKGLTHIPAEINEAFNKLKQD